jgi:uncharacterized membrane protein
MTTLLFGLVIFFSAHTFTMFRDKRQQAIDTIGMLPYRGLYSLVSLGGFVLIVMGYGDAPRVELWPTPMWLRSVAMLLMLPVFVLVAAVYLPGHIKAKIKNPMLMAVKTWALAHLLANGDLASALLFGCFLVWAIIDLVAVKRSGRSSVVDNPKPAFDVAAIAMGLAIYAAILFFGHPYLSGVALV